jgi:hypothetical protein
MLVSLLMAGSTDSAIASSLGINVRSVRRWISDLMDQLGVTTRLQLGAALVRAEFAGAQNNVGPASIGPSLNAAGASLDGGTQSGLSAGATARLNGSGPAPNDASGTSAGGLNTSGSNGASRKSAGRLNGSGPNRASSKSAGGLDGPRPTRNSASARMPAI